MIRGSEQPPALSVRLLGVLGEDGREGSERAAVLSHLSPATDLVGTGGLPDSQRTQTIKTGWV